MDLRTGKYLGIESADYVVLQRLLQGVDVQESPDAATAEFARELQTRGLITSNAAEGLSATIPSPEPISSIRYGDVLRWDRKIGWLPVLRLMHAWARARLQLRFRSLASIVERIERRKAARGDSSVIASTQRVKELALIYVRLRPLFFTAQQECLTDSLTLTEFLAFFGVDATWLVGIQTQPFGAHSWVQYDSLILNDTEEHVGVFTPILAV